MKTSPTSSSNPAIFIRNVLLKAFILLAAINLCFAAIHPINWLGQLSLYNHFFPGRIRLPFGERPDLAYNLSLDNLPAMFASHQIHTSGQTSSEFKVILIGDSSVWGYLLTPAQTLSGQMNQANLRLADGRPIRFYNLGYPTISLTKDVFILRQALHYQPDLIIWLTTLEAFPIEKQLASPILQDNPSAVRAMIQALDLPLDVNDIRFKHTSFWSETILGQRRALADLLRLQIYGILWAATGVDQYYPSTFEPPQHDLDADDTFYNQRPPSLIMDELAFPILQSGIELAGKTPVLLVNEPIYISDGQNSDIRYNFFYPRWAYDEYRQVLQTSSQEHGWVYLDAWDLIPASEFTNSAIHLSPQATTLLADKILASVSEMAVSLEKNK